MQNVHRFLDKPSASIATAARSISAACDEGEVYLPQRSVL